MDDPLIPALFDYNLTDATDIQQSVSLETANYLFAVFKNCPLFKWNDVHNNCEARAEAVSLLLNAWQIPHYKAWVFSGSFLRNHIGGLKQQWNYHVAALLQVRINNETVFYCIDPSTANELLPVFDWAAGVTEYPHSYYFIKDAQHYIFPSGKIQKHNWHKRNRQNKKWTFQGLAGINGVTKTGKAQLCFQKNRVKKTELKFQLFKKEKPSFLGNF
jgi:Glutaminase